MDLPRRTLGLLCVFSLVFVLGAAPAHAEASSGDPVQRVTNLNKKALDQYSQGEFEVARALLKEALEVCNTTGLDRHPIKARTQIHLGIVAIVGFKQKSLGIRFFRKALEIQPEIKLTKSLATPELQDAFEEAMATPGEGGGAEAAAGGPGADDGDGPPAQSGSGGMVAAAAEEDAPRVRRAPVKRKKRPVDDEDENGEDEDEDEDDGGGYKIFIGFALGSGFGIASGSGELDAAHSLKAAGFAPAQLGHITPEVGYFLNRSLLLSARARFQYVSALTGETVTNNSCGSDNYCTPGPFGYAVFARASYFLGEPGKARFFFGGELGGGNIRHAQTFPNTVCGKPGSMTECVDSLKGGPLLFGPVVGLMYDFGKTAGFLASLVTDVGVPNFTINFDLNLGLALHF